VQQDDRRQAIVSRTRQAQLAGNGHGLAVLSAAQEILIGQGRGLKRQDFHARHLRQSCEGCAERKRDGEQSDL
jgi:hypothetical protein